MNALLAYLQQDQFATASGVELLSVAEGHAKARLLLGERHLNAAGVVQGGAVFTLADYAFAAASNSRGQLALGTNATISFLKPCRSGTLIAEATEEALSAKLCTCSVRVTNQDGDLVALFTGTAYRKHEPMPPVGSP